MAPGTEDPYSVKRRKKRKRLQFGPKLPVGTKVEVRSLEDGFQGSWHLGTVIACCSEMREVRYKGLGKLKESVPVLSALDGVGSASSYRGRIRPLPPDAAQDPGELLYGLCVDVYYADAWWEGVIFDHSTGAKERNVFFPDLGDQLLIHIRNFRISQDWVEGENRWLHRGFWAFLKVIEEYQEQIPFPVSVKQIWYDLRQKEGFRKMKEWTCSNVLSWQKMVFNTLMENLKVALSCILPPIDSQGEVAREQSAGLELPEQPSDLDMITETDASKCLSIVHVDETHGKVVREQSDGLQLPDSPSDTDMITKMDASSCLSMVPIDEAPCPKSGRWQPAPNLIPEPECCLDAFASYLVNQAGSSSISARMALKKHLVFLDWKTESRFNGKTEKIRYVSPSGKIYHSLLEICRAQCGFKEVIPGLSSRDARKSLINSSRGSNFSPLSNKDLDGPVFSEDVIPDDRDCELIPADCPQAVVDYLALGLDKCRSGISKEFRLKVKQELVAIGWTLSYRYKEGKREMVYVSPRGRPYTSLRQACRGCIQDGGIHGLVLGKVDHANAGEAGEVKFPSKISPLSVARNPGQKALLPLKTEKVESGRKLRHLKKDTARHLKLKIRFSGAVVKPRDELETSPPTPVLQSCKRVQKIVSGHSHNPKTVLSLLMDNDILLPRLKVYCHRDGSCNSLTEGRVQRDGIRCSCCNDLLTLSNFVSHAGGKDCSPAARVFLGDGRSLLDCQVQFLQKKRRGYLMQDPGDSLIAKSYAEESQENDPLCSICHYGGDLILCDMCPSSFHTNCLGLKDVPDGEWFCPSCCCGICNEGKLGGDIGHFADVGVVSCNQCKRKYHIACLRKRGVVHLGNHPRGNWYCSKKCEQIHGGLMELERKQIRLGIDNLTLTLLKSVDCKIHDDLDLQMKSAAENYVKLNVALDVMHECFEPVKDPYSSRDLIEDVIFNRGSALNRLNFGGFYTVLLEKNDELITVATIRILGEKVAEVPLVGTRFQYRRLGMGHALMDALEKKLKELGVERIILPAIPTALNTWTGSFGFKEMTESERLQLVNYTFLNFQDTTMCQKHLLDIPSVESRVSSGNLALKLADHLKRSPHTELEGSSTASEEFQGKALEGSETGEQATAVKDVNGSCGSVHKVCQMNEPSQPDMKGSLTEDSPEFSTANDDSDERGCRENSRRFFKYYKRRRHSKESSWFR